VGGSPQVRIWNLCMAKPFQTAAKGCAYIRFSHFRRSHNLASRSPADATMPWTCLGSRLVNGEDEVSKRRGRSFRDGKDVMVGYDRTERPQPLFGPNHSPASLARRTATLPAGKNT
jgi:hypothetical protein